MEFVRFTLLAVITCGFVQTVESRRHSTPCQWLPIVSAKSLFLDQCVNFFQRSCVCSPYGNRCRSGKEYKQTYLNHQKLCSHVITWCHWEAWSTSELMQRGSRCYHYSERHRKCCLGGHRRRLTSKPFLECHHCGECNRKARQYPIDCPNEKSTLSSKGMTGHFSFNFSSTALIVVTVIAFFVGLSLIIFYRRQISRFFHRNSSSSANRGSNRRRRERTSQLRARSRSSCDAGNPPPAYDEAVGFVLSPPPYEETREERSLRKSDQQVDIPP